MHRVYEMVKREAERYGAMPVGSEIVGWSREGHRDAADYFLQFENFSPAQVFENKLEAALLARHYKRRRKAIWLNWRIRFWMQWLSRRRHQVAGASPRLPRRCRFPWTYGRRTFPQEEITSRACGQAFRASRRASQGTDALAQAIDRDAASYDAVMAAFKLPQGDAAETQQREDPFKGHAGGRRSPARSG